MPRTPGGRPPLGQHFLSDPRVLARIAAATGAGPDDVVLEIGPGRGTLTTELLRTGARVVAIERDRRLAAELGARSAERGTDRLAIVEGDALELDWHSLIGHSVLDIGHWVVCGNIPYYITTPLIDKALTAPLPRCVVFLVQAEVADRLAAKPGGKEFGALTVGVQAVARVERLFGVPARAFRPPPRVASAVVRLTPLAEPLVLPDEIAPLRRFVTACFGQRRKQLHNAVAVAASITPAVAAAGLEALGLDPHTRAERLAVVDFVRALRWARRL